MAMLRFIAVLTIALVSIANAQSSGGGTAMVRFLAEQVPGSLGEVELVTPEARSGAFKIPTNNLSVRLKAPARSFRIIPVGKTKSLGDITLPEDGKDFIVLLVPGAEKFEAVVMAASTPEFKTGDVYFFNRANKTVLGYVGTAKFTLAPGKGTTLRPKGAREEGFYDVGFGVKEKEGNRAISTTRWPVEENMRSYVFFYVNPSTKRLDFRAIDEFVPPDKP